MMRSKVLVVGNFDGVHKGHQHLLKNAAQISQSKFNSLDFSVVIFDPHPYLFFNKAVDGFYIISKNDKINLLKKMGAKDVISLEFSNFHKLSAKSFFHYLKDNFDCSLIITGEDFSFGSDKISDPFLIKNILQNLSMEHIIINSKIIENQRISSTIIRSLINQGNIEKVNSFLGRSLSYEGTVIHGRKLASHIGFPTANLYINQYAVLKYGVYAVYVETDGKKYQAIANFGLRPTINVSEKQELLEAHLLDYSGDLYGKEIKIDFLKFIREEKKFNGIEELKNNITKDILVVRDFFSDFTS